MQLGVRHLLKVLGLEPEDVPASNLIFVRTRNETAIAGESASLTKACRPFHRAVIEDLGVKVVVCFGGTAGNAVRQALKTGDDAFDTYEEDNGRRWASRAYRALQGRTVVVLPHPSRANWRCSRTDPSAMVRRILGGS